MDAIQSGKTAHVLASQLAGLASTLDGEDSYLAYSNYIRSYNVILDRSRTLFEVDDVLAKSIGQLVSLGEPASDEHPSVVIEKLKADIAVLHGSLRAFFDLHYPAEEKRRIGFDVTD